MQVVHGLATSGAVVYDDAESFVETCIASGGERRVAWLRAVLSIHRWLLTLIFGDLLRFVKKVTEHLGLVLSRFAQLREPVAQLRDDEDMHWRLRGNVAESETKVVLVDHVGWYFL